MNEKSIEKSEESHAGNDERRGERRLVEALLHRLRATTPAGLVVSPGDDMASITPDSPLLWTTDMLMDGVDFRSSEHDWRAIGRKAMAVNLSDCAAMGIQPPSGGPGCALTESSAST